ncbi:MAG: class I SAM-dependent methyltransferase [Saprospiraceae bacterium]
MPESTNYQARWQERAKKFPPGLRAVLFQGLPYSLNEAIHDWHCRVITRQLLPLLPKAGRVLDVGAGYGRLSRIIKKERPDLEVIGIDFSHDFCRVYQQETGPAICADIHHLPLAPHSNDALLIVTVLMYTQGDTQAIARTLIEQLKPGGIALFIEPGYELITWLQKLNSGYQHKTTGGKGFTQEAFLHLLDNASCTILGKGSNIGFTLALPLLIPLNKIPSLGSFLAKVIAQTDAAFNFYTRLSLHRWLMVQRYE